MSVPKIVEIRVQYIRERKVNDASGFNIVPKFCLHMYLLLLPREITWLEPTTWSAVNLKKTHHNMQARLPAAVRERSPCSSPELTAGLMDLALLI